MNFWKKYYYIQQDKKMLHLYENLADIILLVLYVGISFYNAIINIDIMKNTTGDITGLKTTIELLIGLNLIILVRTQFKLRWKIEAYRKDERIRMSEEGKVVSEIYILAWTEKSHIINYGYIAIAVLFIAIYITGNQVVYPIGLVAIFVAIITLIIDLLDNVEDIFGLVPVTYFGERR